MGISRYRLARATALIAVCGIVVLGLGDRDSPSGSAAGSRATNAEDLSAQLSANDLALRQAIDAWRAGGDPPTTPPPKEVMVLARYLQDTVRSLAGHRNLARNTIALLATPLAREIGVLTGAARELRRLSAGWPPHRVRTGRPRPLAELMRYYDAAYRRYRTGQHYLAAIHLVESKFGRVKSDSVAGAQGPMQFLPSTWHMYGHGDIHDPHDAILGAANLLHHAGAPPNYSRALHAYNPSRLYVDAVQRYARLIKRDAYAVYFLYCWGP
ncbi:MAG TPA: lytic transglycosylase domain-containing protein [Solirubrobacterales bacterium]|nr:lytic transglycosylase domain-containing protein [Solirubrobacterales bacterium]